MAAQFEKYKNEEPTTRPSNEFGFGYRVPNQSQVQYIEVPGDAIRQVVSAKISDLDARKYFYQNRAMFPAEPSTKPTTKPASMPTTALAATLPFEPPHEPTFEEAEKKVYERLIAERVNKLTSEILADLNSQMGADYVAFKGAVTETGKAPTTAPSIPEEMLAKAPITSLGVPYGSYEYLKQLALNTQKKFGVLPKTNQDLGPRTDRQLNLAGDIAQSSVEGFDIMSLFRAMGQNFEAVQQIMQQVGPMIRYPTYATNFIVPLATPGVQQAARNFRLRVLALYEPSPLMQGRSMGLSLDSTPSTNNYIFRVVRAEPTHPPTLDEVKDRVLADARMVEAQKLALAEATEFLKGIPSPHSHLESAAKAGSKKLITTGLFSQGQPTVENLDTPPGEPTAIFINAAYQLLNGTSGDRQHPVGLIDFKTAATVFAGEINQIQPGWTPAELPARQLLVGAQIDQQAGGSMRIQWFDAREVRTRTHYVPAQASKKRSSSEEEPS